MNYRLPVLCLLAVLIVTGCAGTAPQPPAAPATEPAPAPAVALPAAVASTPPVAATRPAADTPEGTVYRFYEWLLNYGRNVGSPVGDRAYRTSEFLSPGWIQTVDKAVAGMTRGGFDPFFCAQDTPGRFEVGPAEIKGDRAALVVRTDFANHWIGVDILNVNGKWLIDGVRCGVNRASPTDPPSSATAESVVQGFYDWYLAQLRAGASPLSDKSYEQARGLTAAAVERIGQMLAAFGDGPGYDPILCAQDLPERFVVEPAELAGDQAMVYVRMLWTGAITSSTTVTLKLVDEAWKIDDFTCDPIAVGYGHRPGGSRARHGAGDGAPATPVATDVATANWQEFRDTEYGYQIKYPQGWVSVPPDTAQPAGSVLVRSTGFAPPDAPTGLVPVSVDVYRGSDDEFAAAYPGTGEFEEVEVNGLPALYDRGDPAVGAASYVFQDPAHSHVRVVIRYDLNAAQIVKGYDAAVRDMIRTFAFDDAGV